jgi:hypothetical protein
MRISGPTVAVGEDNFAEAGVVIKNARGDDFVKAVCAVAVNMYLQGKARFSRPCFFVVCRIFQIHFPKYSIDI